MKLVGHHALAETCVYAQQSCQRNGTLSCLPTLPADDTSWTL